MRSQFIIQDNDVYEVDMNCLEQKRRYGEIPIQNIENREKRALISTVLRSNAKSNTCMYILVLFLLYNWM